MSAKKLPTLVITRPRAQLTPLLEHLRQVLSQNAVDANLYPLPLLEIQSTYNNDQARQLYIDLKDADLIIFVSPNAIRITQMVLDEVGEVFPEQKAIGVVGGGSQTELLHSSIQPKLLIKPLDPMHWNAQGLWKQLQDEGQIQEGSKVVFVKGRGGRDDLIQYLTQANVDLKIHEVYKRTPLAIDDPCWGKLKRELLHSSQGSAMSSWLWLLTSSEAVRGLPQAFTQLNLPLNLLHQASALCTHPAIAKAAAEIGFKDILQCLPGDLEMSNAASIWVRENSK